MVEELSLAMPNREFIALRGLSPRIELPVLESIQEDTWFALPSALRADPLAVEVQVGMYRQCRDAIFVDQAGACLQTAQVFAEALAPGARLAALRRYVEEKAGARSELVGYIYHPQLIPRTLLLVYRVTMATTDQDGSAGAWVTKAQAASIIVQPLARIALGWSNAD